MIHLDHAYYTIFFGYDSDTQKCIIQSPDFYMFKYSETVEILDQVTMSLDDFLKDLGVMLERIKEPSVPIQNTNSFYGTYPVHYYYFPVNPEKISYGRTNAFLLPNVEITDCP